MHNIRKDWPHQILFFTSLCVTAFALFAEQWQLLLTWYVYGAILMPCITSAYYHRYVTHNSWACPKWLEVVFLILGAGHGMMSAIGWSNIHTQHHRFADTFKDPHGPHKSFWKNLQLALLPFDPRSATRRVVTNKLYLMQAKYYWWILGVYFIVWCLLFGPISWFFINAHNFIAMVSVNLIGHRIGKPINTPAFSLFVGGEAYHKHHHDHPRDPKFGTIDTGWWIIRLIDKNAKAVKSPT